MKRMKERDMSERERKVSGITWGHFWNISKFLKCFFLKKTLVK